MEGMGLRDTRYLIYRIEPLIFVAVNVFLLLILLSLVFEISFLLRVLFPMKRICFSTSNCKKKACTKQAHLYAFFF